MGELVDRFPGLTPPPIGETGSALWESPDSSTVFEFTWSAQHLLATARGEYRNEQMNTIIDVCLDVGGGRLYDPQTDERFDTV